MRHLAYTLFFTFFSLTLQAQDITSANLVWNVTNVEFVKDNISKSYQCSIETHGNQSIDWKQGAKTYHYTVTQTAGTWSTVSADGEITYTVSMGSEVSGSFAFSKIGNQIKVSLKTSTGGEPDLDLVFSVSTVQLN